MNLERFNKISKPKERTLLISVDNIHSAIETHLRAVSAIDDNKDIAEMSVKWDQIQTDKEGRVVVPIYFQEFPERMVYNKPDGKGEGLQEGVP